MRCNNSILRCPSNLLDLPAVCMYIISSKLICFVVFFHLNSIHKYKTNRFIYTQKANHFSGIPPPKMYTLNTIYLVYAVCINDVKSAISDIHYNIDQKLLA